MPFSEDECHGRCIRVPKEFNQTHHRKISNQNASHYHNIVYFICKRIPEVGGILGERCGIVQDINIPCVTPDSSEVYNIEAEE